LALPCASIVTTCRRPWAFTNDHAPRAPHARCCRRGSSAACATKGIERIVRNDLWKGRPPERFYDALEWLYGWRADACLAD
jgi:hypothetical protein